MAIHQATSLASLLEQSELLSAAQLTEAKTIVVGLQDIKAAARKLIEKGLLTRWQASQLLSGKKSFMLGKYRLLDRLGSGGMGSVFLAEHVAMRRRVAIKTLPHDAAENSPAAQALRAEARAIASLDHPNIVHAYDTELTGEQPYIVMEYVDGDDLQKLVGATDRLDFRRAADYVAQAAEGLAHAHERRLIHRDVKPANLLVDKHGTVKILDLGLAHLKHPDEAGNAQQEQVLGTVDYLAPEQALSGQSFDHRADIYALGCTLYFLLTGQPPFPEGSIAEKLVKHQMEEPRSILKLRPDTPHELVRICRKMMAKKADERFASASDVASALRKWLAESPEEPVQPAQKSDSSGSMPALNAKDLRGSAPAVRKPPKASGNGLDFLTAPAAEVRRKHSTAATANANLAKSGEQAIVRSGAKTPIGVWVALGCLALLLIGATVYLFTRGSDKAKELDVAKKPLATDQGSPEKKGTDKTSPAGGKQEGINKALPAPNDNPAENPPKHSAIAPKPEDKPKSVEKPQSEDSPKPVEPPKPEEKPKAEDKPKTEEPPRSKPEDQPKVKEKPKPVDPFAEFPALADLPPLNASEPIVLSKLSVPPDTRFELSLTGYVKFAPKFQLKKVADAGRPGQFDVRLEGVADDAPAIGTFALVGDELKFRWQSDPKPPADQLRNTLLTVRIGESERVLPLRKWKESPPLIVELEKRTPLNVDIEALPDVEHVFVEILKLTDADVSSEIQPTPIIPLKGQPKKEQTTILIGEIGAKKANPLKNLALVMSAGSRGRAGIKLDALPQFQDANQWFPFNKAKLLQLTMFYRSQPEQIGAQINTLDGNKQKDLIKQLKQQQLLAELRIKEMEELSRASLAVSGKAKLNYRVFTKIEEKEVDLARSLPADIGRK